MPPQAGCTTMYNLHVDLRRVMIHDKTRSRILDSKFMDGDKFIVIDSLFAISEAVGFTVTW